MRKAHRWLVLVIVTSGLLLAGPGGSAQADEATLEERAGNAFADADWVAAGRLYLELSREQPDDPAVWFRLGLATLNGEGVPADAIGAFEKALSLGFASPPALFNIARAHAMDANEPAALDTLVKLADLGPSLGSVLQLAGTTAFDSLRSNKQFVEVVERLTPCNSPEYRQFDFWLGEWEVRSPQGQVLGRNTITETLDGCMLIESWDSASGFKGLSINYFDSSDGSWNQTFRDNTGNVSGWPDLKGGFEAGSMILQNLDDPSNQSRWTWTVLSKDKVRQMAETSGDGGETWTTAWDSFYLRIQDGDEAQPE